MENDDPSIAAGPPSPAAAPATASSPGPAAASGSGSLKQRALSGLPAEWREKLIENGAVAGITHDNDVGWLLVGSVIDSAAAAFAAGDAASEVSQSVDKIPEQIFQGAVSAGRDINLEFRKKFEEYGKTLIVAIDQARDTAINQIKQDVETASRNAVANIQNATKTLEAALDDAIRAKAELGVQEWAEAAQIAGQKSAQSATKKIYSKASIVIGGALLLSMFIGGAIVYLGAGLNNRIAPLPIKIEKGRPDCFTGTDGKAYCQLSGTAKQLAGL